MSPLAGLRIVSIEQFAAGPYGTALLAGLGAEVLKLENRDAGGDPARYTGPFLLGEADSQYFQTWNLNKKAIALDLKDAGDRARFEGLVGGCDAVVNNLRGDQPAKLGLDYNTLSAINPAVVCLHISAYGRDNSRAAWPGYDYLMQAEAGLMSLTGEPGAPPARFGAPSAIDHMTGATAMVGLLAGIVAARSTGKGCDVDVSLFDVALHLLGYAGAWSLNEGWGAERQPRSGHFSVAPVQTYRTEDGWIFIMCMTGKFWEALTRALGQPELGADPRFATNPARFANREALTEALDAVFATNKTAAWLERLNGVLPVAPVFDVGQALASPFVSETGMVQTVDHPQRPGLRMLASPIRVGGERGPGRPCPPLGADTEAVCA